MAIIGPSGGGKSTLLRCINGLDNIDEGSIDMDKEERVGMVFQQFNLFNNMTLLENLTYPQMTVLKRTKEESHKVANQIIRKMNLSGLRVTNPSIFLVVKNKGGYCKNPMHGPYSNTF